MRSEEARAARLLGSMGYLDLAHEPNGVATWPDFALAIDTSVEVRRLNQTHVSRRRPGCRYEYDETPFLQGVEKVLASLGQPIDESWFVHLDFDDEIDGPDLKVLLRGLRASLTRIIHDDCRPRGKPLIWLP